MTRKVILLMFIMASVFGYAQSKPTRDVRMPSETGLGEGYKDYFSYDRGFFAAGELSGGVSLQSAKKTVGFTELDAVGGYRFCDFLRVGAGLGVRYYINGFKHDWGVPLFLNVRGNFISNQYYNVVPYWSFDIGNTFPDGLMVRPSIGIRVGQKRSAFVASIGYMGQNMLKARATEDTKKKSAFYSFITLKIGYEF